ncbi:MAG: class I SAM-dependent methyltransferase [Patescibacteria group bacterium]|nr:class I SAM-dependent methyltransferase [Patescibacteria group bacterium]
MAGETLNREIAVWQDYELLDSGDQMKCERFGAVVVARPEPHALWSPGLPEVWERAVARFEQRGEEGSWQVRNNPPDDWSVRWENLKFGLRLSSFKHTGVFPEQAANWAYLRGWLKPEAQVLNLFGYTGGATLAALSAGASVVHLDASRPAIAAAKHNAELSGFADRPVRWIEDDAATFVMREARRERIYDAIIMDPPAFGRGPNKELWRFESDLLPLLHSCRIILKPGGLLLLNAYSMGFPAIAVEQAVRDVFPDAASIESVELVLQEKSPRGFLLPAGITVRAVI